MPSDRARLSLAARSDLREVLSAVDIRVIVDRISEAEHAFPALTLAAHFRASAMVVILAIKNTSSG